MLQTTPVLLETNMKRMNDMHLWTALIAVATGSVVAACADKEPQTEDRGQASAAEESQAESGGTKEDGGHDAPESTDSGAPACSTVTLARRVCASSCDVVEKRVDATTCAAGCPTVEMCYVEISTGDIYTLACDWALEDASTRWRPCNDAERETLSEVAR